MSGTTFEKEKLWDQYSGTMTWEYILIPRASGRYQLPRIQLSFLNPKNGSWNKVGTKSISLNALQGENNFISSTKGFTKEEIADEIIVSSLLSIFSNNFEENLLLLTPKQTLLYFSTK